MLKKYFSEEEILNFTEKERVIKYRELVNKEENYVVINNNNNDNNNNNVNVNHLSGSNSNERLTQTQ
jgi:hypothetical protein